jgi:Putative esterase
MRFRVLLGIVLCFGLVAGLAAIALPADPEPLRFRISFGPEVRDRPITGRAMVIVAPSDEPEPRFQTDVIGGAPFWGQDVSSLDPGEAVVFDGGSSEFGYPLRAMSQLPPGDYHVQAFMNVYMKFERADGSVVWLHRPCGDGHFMFDSPRNLYSDVAALHIDPNTGGTFNLRLSNKIEPADPVPPGGTCQQGNPADSRHVKHVKIKSDLLTKYWGRDTYIGANILLPKGYGSSTDRYPVVYNQTHFPFENPFGFVEDGSNDFSKWWLSFAAPRVLAVEIRHENPYYDDSYAVNSENLGPYGDAITEELIPHIDRHFRTFASSWARVQTGGSTGGWEALAQQIFYPDMFGGTWSICPDSLDFRAHQLINIYEDENAYVHKVGFNRVPRPSARTVPGDTIWTMTQENRWELAMGTNGRSGGQWDIWQAVYGPQAADGYPAPIWNKKTGAINHDVAEGWRDKDLRVVLSDNWDTLGPKLRSKLRIYIGDDDTFFLNNGVEHMARFLRNVENPSADAEIRFGRNQPHCWSPYSLEELITIMAQEMQDNAPDSAAAQMQVPQARVHPGDHLSKPVTTRG